MFADPLSDPDLLAQHTAWLRRLAQRLSADGHAADDLAQETWLAWLRSPVRELGSQRGFLAGILRNRARQEQRADSRRRDREERVGPAGLAPSAEEAFSKAEHGRELARLVLELEEPFRSVVLLRFWEDLPLSELALRLGIPRKTAESRLARGLAKLRARWRAGERKDARAMYLPLGALIMNTKLVTFCAAVLLIGGAFLLWNRGDERPAGSHVALSPTSPADAQDPAQALASSAELDARTTIEPTPDRAAPHSAAPLAGPALHRVHGRVLDPEAHPLARIAIAFVGPGASNIAALSGADGGFELELPRVDGVVRATDPALVTLSTASVRAASQVELLVVVAPHRKLAGKVIDTHGAPVARARVKLQPPRGFTARFEAVLDAASFLECATIADTEGRFELDGAPILSDATLLAAREGFQDASIPAPQSEALDVAIVLEQAEGEHTLAGRVVDRDGRVVPGAWVTLGARTTQSDARGEFLLDTEGAEHAVELLALAHGHRPARLHAALDAVNGKPLFPAWVELVLGDAPLEFAGVVVDEQGRPRAGIRLWISDPTPFGVLEDESVAKIEFVLGSQAAAQGDLSQVYWNPTTTDAEGRFTLGGLLEREYSIRLIHPKTLQTASAGPFVAGTRDLRVVMPEPKLQRLAGRAVTSSGRPLAGVRVVLLGEEYGGVWENAAQCTTDDQGRFAFDGVAGTVMMLWMRGDDVIPHHHSLGAIEDGKELEIVLSARCHLKVDLGPHPELADRMLVLDASGERLSLYEIGSGGVTEGKSMNIVDGRSTTLGVADSAATLVLEKQGVEVRRIALVLLLDRLNVVTP